MIHMILRVGWTATLVVLASCASYTPVSAPVPVPANLQWSDPVVGYKAGAEALTEANEQERYFDGDLNRAGMIPIQVVIRNTDGAPALVRRSDMALVLPDGRAIAPSSAQMAASKVGEDGSVVGATLMFGIFGLLAAASAEDDARAARTSDYRYMQLKDTTLGAGSSAQGIVFFIVPVGTPDFDAATLRLHLVDVDTAERTTIEVPLTDIDHNERRRQAPVDNSDTDPLSESTP